MYAKGLRDGGGISSAVDESLRHGVRNHVITHDILPKSSADLSSFKSGIPDGSSGSKTAMVLYRSFATRSKAIEPMHGTYETV